MHVRWQFFGVQWHFVEKKNLLKKHTLTKKWLTRLLDATLDDWFICSLVQQLIFSSTIPAFWYLKHAHFNYHMIENGINQLQLNIALILFGISISVIFMIDVTLYIHIKSAVNFIYIFRKQNRLINWLIDYDKST